MEFANLADNQLDLITIKTRIELNLDNFLLLIKGKSYNSSTIRSAKNFLLLIHTTHELTEQAIQHITISNDLETIKQEIIQDTIKLQELYDKYNDHAEGRKTSTPLKSLRVLIQDVN
tara:strand:- start:267 stop:617 length:351 start_codon:yes stop_codon:yes gene_type:complete